MWPNINLLDRLSTLLSNPSRYQICAEIPLGVGCMKAWAPGTGRDQSLQLSLLLKPRMDTCNIYSP